MNKWKLLAKIGASRVSSAVLAGYHFARRQLAAWPEVSGAGGKRSTARRFSLRRLLPILGVVVSLLLLTVASVEAKPKSWTTICRHVVQPRESIYSIARAYGVSPSAIAAHNRLSNPSLIYAGQALEIPNAYALLPSGPTCPRQCVPVMPCTCKIYHTITRGESLYRIGSRYGVSMWRIAECNSITNLNLIRAGAVLCIPTTP